MSINMHTVSLNNEDLADIDGGLHVIRLSDKEMTVQIYPEAGERPPARDGVATCPLSDYMIADLRREGHTGIALRDSPYFFSFVLTH